MPEIGLKLQVPAATQYLLGLIGFVRATATPPNDARPALKDLAQAQLRRLHRQVRGAGEGFAAQDSAARHRARKRLKRLRSCAEFTSALGPRAPGRPIATPAPRTGRVRAMQDNATAEPLYRTEAEHDPRAWFAVGWLGARREVLVAEAGGALRDLGKTPKFLR